MELKGAQLGNCSICSAPYEKSRTRVVEENQDTITLHIDCAGCGSSALVAIQAGFKGFITTVGMPTDLTKTDLNRLRRRTQVNSDDVIKLHEHFYPQRD